MNKKLKAFKRIAIINREVRSDFVEPLYKAKDIKIHVFYKYASYKDLDLNQCKDLISKYYNFAHLFFLLIKYNPHIIFVQEPFFLRVLPISMITQFYSKIFKKEYIVSMIDNVDPEIKYGKRLNNFLRFFYKINIDGAKFIVALNKDAKHLTIKYAGIKNVDFKNLLVGIWGVNLKSFSPKSLDDDPKLGKNTVLFVGRLIEGKGILNLLDAMLMVRKKVKNAQLYVIGDGPLKSNIIDFSSKNKWVHYLGSIENKFLPGYFRAAKVTCVPSITTRKWAEQVGLVNIQSIACGTPVVSTTSGAIPEYIPDGEAGILVKENDAKELSEALIKLLADDELNKSMGYNGRALAAEKYDAYKNFNFFETFIRNNI